MNPNSMTNERLCTLAQKGDEAAREILVEKNMGFIVQTADLIYRSLSLEGSDLNIDMDDLVQEGMIGLFKAVRDFDRSQGSFYYFADLCIGRQIYHAIEAASRKKHGPLNSYISLSEDASDTSGVPLAESISWREDNPEQILIERENVEQFLEEIRSNLSPLEQKVLTDYLDGMNYRQIAEKWNKPEKSIDNALQRIKSKVQKLRSCK